MFRSIVRKPLRTAAFRHPWLASGAGTPFMSPVALTAPPAAHFHATAPVIEGMVAFNKLKKEDGWEDLSVNLGDLIEVFRQLRSLETLRTNQPPSEASTEYRNAERVLFQLGYDSKTKKLGKTAVTLREIHHALPETQGRCWRTIREMANGLPVSRLSDLSDEELVKIQFLRIGHIGKTYADKLYDAGCRTLKDLKKEEKKSLTHAQRVSLRYRKELEELIPRSEVEEIKGILLDAVKRADPELEGDILGSYRRGNPFSSDVDLILKHPSITRESDEKEFKAMIRKVVDEIEEHIVETTADGSKIYRGFFRLNNDSRVRSLDVVMSPCENYAYKLLGSSGDDRLVKIMRSKAKELGLFLNDQGMGKRIKHKGTAYTFDPETVIEAKTERDVFEALNLPYLEPHERNFKHYRNIKEYGRLGDKKTC